MKRPTPNLSGATLIGAPKLSDFPAMAPHEVDQIEDPLVAALAKGMNPQEPAAIPTFILCRLVTTCRDAFGEWQKLADLLEAVYGTGAVTASNHPAVFLLLKDHADRMAIARARAHGEDTVEDGKE